MKTLIYLGVIITLIASSFACSSDSGSGDQTVKNIGADEFQKVVSSEKAIVVDVRTPEEIAEGIIEGTTVFADFTGSNFEAEINKLDKSKTYVIYCKSGGRSSAAAEMMSEKGFKHIYNLEGGITDWTGNITNP